MLRSYTAAYFCGMRKSSSIDLFGVTHSRPNSAANAKSTWTRLWCSYAEVITTKMNLVDRYEIYIFKWQLIFCFILRFSFFLLSPTRLLAALTAWVVLRVFCKKQELLNLREHLGSQPVFLMGSVLRIVLVFLCCVFCFVCLRSVSCAQCCLCL